MEAKLSIWSGYYGDFPIEGAVMEFIKDGIYATELSHEHGEELLARSDDRVATGKALRAFLEANNRLLYSHTPVFFLLLFIISH